MRKTEWSLSDRLRELKTKEKSSWVILKVVEANYGSGRLRELKFSLQSSSHSSNGVHACGIN